MDKERNIRWIGVAVNIGANVSDERGWYGRARKRVVFPVGKAFSKTALKLTPKGRPTPKRGVLQQCVVGNNDAALPSPRQI
jgi:hypothetical protein